MAEVDMGKLEQPQPLRLLPMTNTRVRKVKDDNGHETIVVDRTGPCVRDKVGLHPATIYDLVKASGFPPPIKVGRRSLWIEHEVDEWILAQVKSYRESA